jgi:hypothetical protein
MTVLVLCGVVGNWLSEMFTKEGGDQCEHQAVYQLRFCKMTAAAGGGYTSCYWII